MSNLSGKVYFLDICIINDIKEINQGNNDSKLNIVQEKLIPIDKEGNKISIALMILEKNSDKNMKLEKSKLQEKIISDIKELEKFFKNAKILETVEFIEKNTDGLYGENIEYLGENYMNFLKRINNEIEPHNQISLKKESSKIPDKIKKVLLIADESNIPRRHHIILLVVASIYGTNFAQKILKWSINNFNPSNALADIMSVSRLLLFIPKDLEVKVEFVTSDDGLEEFFNCINIYNKNKFIDEYGFLNTESITQPDMSKFFPKFFHEKKLKKELEEHYKNLLELLGYQYF